MSSSCRIDFNGQQGGFCVSEPVRISRTQPAALTSQMSPQGWTEFCDRIDAALVPLDRVKSCSRISMFIFFGGFIIFMIAPFTWLSTSSSNPYDQGPGFSFFAFIIGPLLLMLGMIVTQCYAAQKAKDVMNDVRQVCDDISRQYSSLSFHVRFQYYLYGGRYGRYGYGNNQYQSGGSYTTNYIEVSIANIEAPSATVPGYVSSTPVVAVPAADYGKSAAERLADLENIRGMLSDEEYNNKRKEILDSV